MKLIYYDQHHEYAVNELDLGEITDEQAGLLGRVISWMENSKLLDGRYRCLTLANGWRHECDSPDADAYLVFN